MKKRAYKLVSLWILAAILASVLAGCGNSTESAAEVPSEISSEGENEAENSSEADTSSETTDPEETEEQSSEQESEAIAEPESDASSEEQEALEEEPDDGLTDVQRNSVEMLNYITVLASEINNSARSKLILDELYSEVRNNMLPSAIDKSSEEQIISILDTIHSFSSSSVKRSRIQYVYEQRKAKAIRDAIPTSKDFIKAVIDPEEGIKKIAGLIGQVFDFLSGASVNSSDAELDFLASGWALDDAEAAVLHTSRNNLFGYTIDIVHAYDLPDEYAMNENAADAFNEWKEQENTVRRLDYLEKNADAYVGYSPYWLELAQSYCENEQYEDCINAITTYEHTHAHIFRKDYDYAQAMPAAITAAYYVYESDRYVSEAERYISAIMDNTDNDEWELRYLAAQTYISLYKVSNDEEYLSKTYDIIFRNVNHLIDEQEKQNAAYLADVKEVEPAADATKEEKNDIKEYNKLLKEERKTALPPVYEPLYLNCELLYALAEKLDISSEEANRISSMLYGTNESLFLCGPMNELFRWENGKAGGSGINTADIEVEFTGKEIKLPAEYVSEGATVYVTITDSGNRSEIKDWVVKSVDRNKSHQCSDFVVTFSSAAAKDYK